MQEQSSLGTKVINKSPSYNMTQIGRVTSVAGYDKYGRIEVVFLDYSKPLPVWVNGDIDKKPVEGDQVLVGFINGRQDAPYLAGFIRNENYTSNFLKVEKDKIIIQLPADTVDSNGHLLDDNKKGSRVRIEVTNSGVTINGAYAARVGDSVSVSVPAIGALTGTCIVTVPGIGDCTGTIAVDVPAPSPATGSITSGASK